MTHILLENLDPIVVEKPQIRANRLGRSLIEELQGILEEAVKFETIPPKQETLSEGKERFGKVRQRYQGRTFRDSAELLREDRQR